MIPLDRLTPQDAFLADGRAPSLIAPVFARSQLWSFTDQLPEALMDLSGIKHLLPEGRKLQAGLRIMSYGMAGMYTNTHPHTELGWNLHFRNKKC